MSPCFGVALSEAFLAAFSALALTSSRRASLLFSAYSIRVSRAFFSASFLSASFYSLRLQSSSTLLLCPLTRSSLLASISCRLSLTLDPFRSISRVAFWVKLAN